MTIEKPLIQIPMTKTTRYIAILALLCTCFLFYGCGGDEAETPGDASDFYFRFKLDGEQHDYTILKGQTNLTGSSAFDEGTDKYVINISGIKDLRAPGKNTVSIFVSDSEGFPTGINFSNFPDEGDDYPDFLFNMAYYDSEGNIYLTGGQGDLDIYTEIYEPGFVKFLEITDTYISGAFSGTLIDYETSSGTNVFMGSVEITDGEFKVKRAK